MRTGSALILAGSLAACMTAASFASAEPVWKVRHGNGSSWAEARSVTHGSEVNVQCDDTNKSIAFILIPPASWNGDAGYKLKLLVDDSPFAVVADGADNGVILSNLPKEKIGIDKALRRALKSGKSLVVEGPPAAGIPVKQRTFSLDGASAAIERIESGCPGVR